MWMRGMGQRRKRLLPRERKKSSMTVIPATVIPVVRPEQAMNFPNRSRRRGGKIIMKVIGDREVVIARRSQTKIFRLMTKR